MNKWTKKSLTILAMANALIWIGCVDGGQVCTEEFKIVGVEVQGEPLEDHFTIRDATGDTLRHTHDISENFYTVLDDNMQPALEGKSETFTFIGIQDGTKVVEESYEFEADECHIERITGPVEIDL